MKSKKQTAQDQNMASEHPRGAHGRSQVHPGGEQRSEDVARLEDQLKRALADYQNLERRVEEERRLLGTLSSAILIEKFLPVLDNLESAQTHLNDQGLDIVIKQFKDILTTEGVEEISAESQTFDPNLHEAVEVTEGPDEGRIVKITRKGYKINDKVLRPAQVVVEKNSAGQSQEQEQILNQVQDDNIGVNNDQN